MEVPQLKSIDDFSWIKGDPVNDANWWNRREYADTRLWLLFSQIACDLAYEDEGTMQRAMRKLGLESKLVSVGNTQVHLIHGDFVRIVAFRGTKPDAPEMQDAEASLENDSSPSIVKAIHWLKRNIGPRIGDFIDDIRIVVRAKHPSGGRTHKGFHEAANRVEDQIAEWRIRTDKNQPEYWVGHSLGAGCALDAAGKIYDTLELFVYGCPRMCNQTFARKYQHLVFRFSRVGDWVTRIPTLWTPLLKFWTHLGRCNLIDDAGHIHWEMKRASRLSVYWTNIKSTAQKRRLLRDVVLLDEHGSYTEKQHQYHLWTVERKAKEAQAQLEAAQERERRAAEDRVRVQADIEQKASSVFNPEHLKPTAPPSATNDREVS